MEQGPFLPSGLVADLLGIPVHRLGYLTRDRQLRPRKGHTGAFMWSWKDVLRASQLLKVAEPDERAFREAAVGTAP
jgi:hypothetical protein